MSDREDDDDDDPCYQSPASILFWLAVWLVFVIGSCCGMIWSAL